MFKKKEAKAKKCPCHALFKLIRLLIMILCPVIGILFIVYFWNIDQKVMAGLYKLVNKVFDEKKVDLNF